jgi:tetratricopeptide (TPR) repeat protein
MAICFDQKEQFMVSRSLYEAVLQIEPNNTSSLYNLANIMLVLGKNIESAGIFERALTYQPENYQRRTELIELYETMNDLNKA